MKKAGLFLLIIGAMLLVDSLVIHSSKGFAASPNKVNKLDLSLRGLSTSSPSSYEYEMMKHILHITTQDNQVMVDILIRYTGGQAGIEALKSIGVKPTPSLGGIGEAVTTATVPIDLLSKIAELPCVKHVSGSNPVELHTNNWGTSANIVPVDAPASVEESTTPAPSTIHSSMAPAASPNKVNKLDLSLRGLSASGFSHRFAPGQHLLTQIPPEEMMKHILHITTQDNQVMVDILIRYTGGQAGIEALKSIGVKPTPSLGDEKEAVTTATVPVDLLSKIAELSCVKHVAGSNPVELYVDKSCSEVKANVNRSLQQTVPPVWNGYTGKGVIIGIIDSGIDINHEDFKDASGKSRILYLWDQSNYYGSHPFGYEYGTEWEKSDIDVGWCSHKDTIGHGTLVAGIAAGNGAATGNLYPSHRYVGVAPEADLIVVKIGWNYEKNIEDAISYIEKKAFYLQKPFVINLSLGMHLGAHDGTSEYEFAVNRIPVDGGQVVVSAGNHGSAHIHAQGELSTGQAITHTFNVPSYTPNSGSNNDFIGFDMWYNGAASVSVKVISPNGHSFNRDTGERAIGIPTSDGAIIINNASEGVDSNNSDNECLFLIKDYDENSPPVSGEWKIMVTGIDIKTTGAYDIWLYDSRLGVFSRACFSSNYTDSKTVAIPATAESAIAVGAYCSRNTWLSSDGNGYECKPYAGGQIWTGSSQGPTRDGRVKPDITAPGYMVISALSADTGLEYSNRIVEDGKHWINEGTSVSTPHVTGVVALMLQAQAMLPENERIPYWEYKERITNLATTDESTGFCPNNIWGYGKLAAPYLLSDLFGQLTETNNIRPIANARIRLLQGGVEKKVASTNEIGEYIVRGFMPGEYEIEVTALDYHSTKCNAVFNVGNTKKIDFLLERIDRIPSDTSIVSGPDGQINYNDIIFEWRGTDTITPVSGLQYSYKLDNASWLVTSTTTVAYSKLTDGSHTFSVKTRDDAGNESTPATRTFIVDTTPPNISIVKGPAGSINANTVTLEWRGTDTITPASGLQYSYKLDKASWSVTSTTTVTYSNLKDGSHTFSVKARDAAGNESSTATRTFVVDTTPPDTSIINGPDGSINYATVTIEWRGTDTITSASCLQYSYRLDNNSWSTMTSTTSVTYSKLIDGSHTFSVKARDEVGNVDTNPAIREFVIVVPLPVIPAGLNYSTNLSWSPNKEYGFAFYNVYRNGTKIGSTTLNYYDCELKLGTSTYTVTAVNKERKESGHSQPIVVNIAHGSISGKAIRLSNKQPLGLVKVEVSQNGIIKASTTTTSDGTYEITNLIPGEYYIKASIDIAVQSQKITIGLGKNERCDFLFDDYISVRYEEKDIWVSSGKKETKEYYFYPWDSDYLISDWSCHKKWTWNTEDGGSYIDKANNRLVIKIKFKGKWPGCGIFWRKYKICLRKQVNFDVAFNNSNSLKISEKLYSCGTKTWYLSLSNPQYKINRWSCKLDSSANARDVGTYIDKAANRLVVMIYFDGKKKDLLYNGREACYAATYYVYGQKTDGLTQASKLSAAGIPQEPLAIERSVPMIMLATIKETYAKNSFRSPALEQRTMVGVMVKNIDDEITSALIRVSFDPKKINIVGVETPKFENPMDKLRKDLGEVKIIDNGPPLVEPETNIHQESNIDETKGMAEIKIEIDQKGDVYREGITTIAENISSDKEDIVSAAPTLDNTNEDENIVPIAYLVINQADRSSYHAAPSFYSSDFDDILSYITISSVELFDTDGKMIPSVMVNNHELVSDSKQVYCYPNPTDTGQIIFANLSNQARVKIYNIAGELVYDKECTPIINGEWTWKCINNDNDRLASGIFSYVVTDIPTGKKEKGKLCIVR